MIYPTQLLSGIHKTIYTKIFNAILQVGKVGNNLNLYKGILCTHLCWLSIAV